MKKLKWIFAISILIFAISCSQNEKNTNNTAETQEMVIEQVRETPESIADITTIEEETETVTDKVEAIQEEIEAPVKPNTKPNSDSKPTPKPAPVETETSTPTKVEPTPVKPIPTKPTRETTKPIDNKNNIPKEIPKDAAKPKPTKETKKTASPSHAAFNGLLSKYVNSNGAVNYSGFKNNENQLGDYLKSLAENPVESSWSRNEKLAYWINLYNAATLKLILENYPVKSIQDINSGKPWDKRWIKSGNKTYTLNEIENSIIRPQFNEPLIHFAVNCAAQSCPRLMNKAFTKSNVNSLMRENAKWFINNSKFNKISKNKGEVSKIFDWYGKDFGNLNSYLSKYSNTNLDSDAKITFMEYDWDLNKQ